MNEPAARACATVVIVNFDGGQHVRRCLECLAKQTLLPDHVIIVDNASTDGSLSVCRDTIRATPHLADRTTIDEVGANIGFAAACNRASASATTEFVALLNPDAFPEPSWLAALVTAARANGDCAAFGSRQLRAGDTSTIDGIGDRWHVSGLSYREGHGRPVRPADLEPREIFSPCAAAALYRRKALLAIGGFDEDYFCFGEDVDLGYRLRITGSVCRYVPEAIVEHVGGGSTPSDVATYYGHRNVLWTLVKNTPAGLLPLSLLGHAFQSILVGIVLGFRGRGRAFLIAKWDAFRGLPMALRKRGAIQGSRKISTWTLCRMLDMGVRRRR